MKIGHTGSVVILLVLSIASDAAWAAGPSTRVRYVCDNPVAGGVPNKFEIDFSHKTILEFEGSGVADDPITPDDASAHAVISSEWIRWTDITDGQKYTIHRSIGELKKWLSDGTVLYTKTCREWPAGTAWPVNRGY